MYEQKDTRINTELD